MSLINAPMVVSEPAPNATQYTKVTLEPQPNVTARPAA
jgi:hypothetical protein